MKSTVFVAMLALGLAAAGGTGAAAKGCVKGAVVGGVAGHFLGHHGWTGAAAGCVIGHHEATKKTQLQRQNTTSDNDGDHD